MSSERNAQSGPIFIGSYTFPKREALSVVPNTPVTEDVKSAPGLITRISSWLTSTKRPVEPEVAAFMAEMDEMTPDLFSPSDSPVISQPASAELIQSKNVIARGVGPENMDVATNALRFIHEANVENVR